MKYGARPFIQDQLCRPVPPVATADLTWKTVVVIGANTGIGFEASKHFARMSPGRLILACRSVEKGSAAVAELQEATGYKGAELWIVDLAKFSSVIAFADRFEKENVRCDILVANAAVNKAFYTATSDGWEESLQVNCLSLSLLCLLLAPRLVETAQRYPDARPRIVIVASEAHYWTDIKDKVYNYPSIFATIGSKEYCTPSKMRNRYLETKLITVFFMLSLADLLKGTAVIVNAVTPGYCYSGLNRNTRGLETVAERLLKASLGRSTEEGSRQIVYAAVGAPENPDLLRGTYINLHEVTEPSDHVLGEDGKRRRDKLWTDLVKELSQIDGRVGDIIGQLSEYAA